MKNNLLKRIIISLISFVILSVISYFVINGLLREGNKLKSIDMNTVFGETKTTYYAGETFDPEATFVNLVYYDRDSNTEWTLKDYCLVELSEKIPDIKYEVTGFNSSVAVNSQTVKLTVFSEKYAGRVSVEFNIEILPARVVSAEVINSANYLKDYFVLNETLNYENFQIKNTYSNGKTEIVNVTSEMVTGFNTAVASTKIKTLTINQNGYTLYHEYVVIPSENYLLFDEGFMKCFVPSTNYGFTALNPEQNIFSFSKGSVATIELGYYEKFSYTEADIIALYNTGPDYDPNVSVLSYEQKNVNGISLTVCKFQYDYSSTVWTGIYFDRVLVGTGDSGESSSFDATVEIIFKDYANTSETTQIFNTILNSITL